MLERFWARMKSLGFELSPNHKRSESTTLSQPCGASSIVSHDMIPPCQTAGPQLPAMTGDLPACAGGKDQRSGSLETTIEIYGNAARLNRLEDSIFTSFQSVSKSRKHLHVERMDFAGMKFTEGKKSPRSIRAV